MKIWRVKNDVIITAAFVHVLIGLQTVVISSSISSIASSSTTLGVVFSPTSSDSSLSSSSLDMGVVTSGTTSSVLSSSISFSASSFSSPPSSSTTANGVSSQTSSDASLSSLSSHLGVVASGTTSSVLSLPISSSAFSFSSPHALSTTANGVSSQTSSDASLSSPSSDTSVVTSRTTSSVHSLPISFSASSSSSPPSYVTSSPSVSDTLKSEATSAVRLVASQSSSQFLKSTGYSILKPTSSATPLLPTNDSSSSINTSPSIELQSRPKTTRIQPRKTTTDKTPYSTPIFPTPTPTPQKQPDVSISITFSILWERFCYLIPLFKGRLSRRLIEMKGLAFNFVSIKRIKLLNGVTECQKTSYYNKDVVLKFYVSNSEMDLGPEDANVNLTLVAYKILYYYWVNKRMILLEKVFENKVEEVKLYARNPYLVPDEGITESVHIGRAIGIAMGVVLLILLIAFLVTWRPNVIRTRTKAKERRLIFANSAALIDEADGNREPSARPPSYSVPRTEAETVLVHTPPEPPQESDPGPSATHQEPVLEVIKNYEADKTEEESFKGLAPLAKPEPDSVSEGEPIRAPEKLESAVTRDDKPTTSQPESKDTLQPENTVEDVDKQEPTEPPSGVSDEKTKPEEPVESVNSASDDKIKPEFDQPEDAKTDQGVINLGFDEITEPEHDEEEETKF